VIERYRNAHRTKAASVPDEESKKAELLAFDGGKK
jgi:hypothetical protein